MAARIVRIILDQLTSLNYGFDLIGTDHALRTRHLPDRVGQKQQPFSRGPSNVFKNRPLNYLE
jgi:hypothetical protein